MLFRILPFSKLTMKYLTPFIKISDLLVGSNSVCIRNCASTLRLKERQRKIIYYPSLTPTKIQNIENVVGLHIGLNHLSWVKIELKDNNITQMGITNFPDNFEKMNLSELYSFAFQSFQMLPKANHYIMEELMKVASGSAGRQLLLLQSSRMQYISMLVALFNSYKEDEKHTIGVLFLKYMLPARLFGILVGSEIVSSTRVVNDILTHNISTRYTPVKCSTEINFQYNAKNKIEKEIIGQSLLLTLTFLELVVYQNDKCFQFIGISSLISKNKKTKEIKVL